MSEAKYCASRDPRTGEKCELIAGHGGAHIAGLSEASNALVAWGLRHRPPPRVGTDGVWTSQRSRHRRR